MEQTGLPSTFVREGLLQARENGKVRCLVCERRCLLVDGGTGWCQTRVNHDGKLVTLTYGAVSSMSSNPIEKKPFYHFYPGSRALTAGSWGCNFGCPWCQNWNISKKAPPGVGDFMSPIDFVEEALRRSCQGTSISFNEPTLSLEWSLDVFRLARDRGLYNTFVTNGYMTAEALELLVEAGLDGVNVDIKGDADVIWWYAKGVDTEKIWDRCRQAQELGIHLEITTLVVSGVNDSEEVIEEIASRIASDLGVGTPFHISGFYPAYRFVAPPTRITSLEHARAIGQNAGLQYVYLGNFPGHPFADTHCPECGTLLVTRFGFELVRSEVKDGRCPSCGQAIPGVGWQWNRLSNG